MMESASTHIKKVAKIQEQMKALLTKRDPQVKHSPISIQYQTNHTNTTRSKSYKKGCPKLEMGMLNEIIQIDPQKKIAIVEPRVTMEQLVSATLQHGLIPPVVPEFKEITVGGAVMGGAGESGSHRWGSFNDICLSYEILSGDGNIVLASETENADLFYGFPCSYGSLGILLSATIQLIVAKDFVQLKYHLCSSSSQAIEKLKELTNSPIDFLDGIVYSQDKIIIIEGSLVDRNDPKLPQFSTKPITAPWYYQHVETLEAKEEIMPLCDYLFRYDQGAFWVGGFLFRPELLIRYLFEGILKLKPSKQPLTDEKIAKLHSPPRPSRFLRTILHPALKTKNLWKMFHLADIWAQTHSILQDFCIPEENAAPFLANVMEDPKTFPMWLCPIKSTHNPQIFAPHNTSSAFVINVGIYGLPSYYTSSTETVTQTLEKKARDFGGKKVLYSCSFYTKGEFWQIYSQNAYLAL